MVAHQSGGLGVAGSNPVRPTNQRSLAVESRGAFSSIARGVDDLTVRMDSELVVKQLAGVYRVKHPGLIPLHARAKALLRKFAQVDVAHVRRKDNAAADAVVNQILDAAR